MNEISAVIVVKDNPSHLFETISSIEKLVKEIVIVDIGINKLIIPRLKQNKKIKIIKIKKQVLYVEIIREEIKKYAACEYILFLDPDEVFPEELTKQLSSLYLKYSYFKIPRKNIIFEKWIKHSRWWPDYQIRLFKKNAVTWPKQIHNQPVAKGNQYTFPAEEKFAIIHYNYENIDGFMEKFSRYAKAEASELQSFSLKEALKKALSEFISRYFAGDGYKDGIHGFILAFLQMFYYFLVYVYYWERKKYQEDLDESPFISISEFFKNGLYEINHWLIQKKLISGLKKIKLRLYNSFSKSI